MLRIANAVLGDDGVMVLDLASQLPWSRASLADELAHDADLDIEAMYCLHSVQSEDESRTDWLHTHGLAELGGFDVDVVAPHPEFVDNCADPFRAIATMILDREIAPDQGRLTFGAPGGEARLVPAATFMREAGPELHDLRDAPDHDANRSVLCEPVGRKLFGFGRGDRPEPLHLARRPPPDRFVVYFPTSTTTLMAERARGTVGVLRDRLAEFAEFEPVAIVKLGYPTTGGSHEHLWFTAHAIGETTVDATLENEPFGVDLQVGERAERPLDLLTDWAIITPAGWITPRSMIAARRLREHADEIRASMAEAKAEAQAGTGSAEAQAGTRSADGRAHRGGGPAGAGRDAGRDRLGRAPGSRRPAPSRDRARGRAVRHERGRRPERPRARARRTRPRGWVARAGTSGSAPGGGGGGHPRACGRDRPSTRRTGSPGGCGWARGRCTRRTRVRRPIGSS